MRTNSGPECADILKGWALHFARPVPYGPAMAFQGAVHAARVAGRVPDTLLLLEHKPTITLGRRRRDNYLLWSLEECADRGIDVHVASRGGDVTYHGPGQWVVYPVFKLGTAEADAHGWLWNFEEVAIRTAAEFGVEAWRREGMNGAWSSKGKIAAIGFHLKRWVSLHGMSFNVDVDLTGFSGIVACGLEGEPVASLKTCLADATPETDLVATTLLHQVQAVFGRNLEVYSALQACPPALADLIVEHEMTPFLS